MFFEIFRDFRGINLSKMCMNVSCDVELVSDMEKIWGFYQNMLHNLNAVISMAKRLVIPFKQIPVCYTCVINSESGHDIIFFVVDCFGSIAQTLLGL